MTQPKRDAEALLNDLLPFAKTMLAQHGEFHPYGGYIKADGSIVQVGAVDPRTDTPRATDLLEIIKAEYRIRARTGDIKATALVSNVHVMPPHQASKCDAIQVTIEHADSYCADVFLPYQVHKDGELVFGEMFAQQGERSVFLDAV